MSLLKGWPSMVDELYEPGNSVVICIANNCELMSLGDDGPQENENDSDNVSLDYMEGAEVPDKMKPLSRSNKAGEEVIPSNVVYSQPHSIQKLPNELGPGQIDNFERPYMRGTKNINQPMQQNTYATGKVFNYLRSKVFYYCFINPVLL